MAKKSSSDSLKKYEKKKLIILDSHTQILKGLEIKILTIKDKKGQIIKSFVEDKDKVKLIDDNKPIDKVTDKTASKEAIRKYFQVRAEREGFIYEPKTKKELAKEQKTFLKKHDDERYAKAIKVFKNKNKLIFTNKRLIKNFDYTYVQVKLKIYFDGFYTIASGRAKYHPNHITDRQLKGEIYQAIRNCLAPFGSNLKFDLLDWNYVYHVTTSIR